MGIPTFKTVDDHVMPPLVREGFDQKLARFRQAGAALLNLQPVADLVWKARPIGGCCQERADAVG